MHRILSPWTLAAVTLLVVGSPAPALRIAAPGNVPLLQKVINADAVVNGKVTGLEKGTLELEPHPMGAKVPHTVAVLKLESALLGPKNVTHIKVVFPDPTAEPEPAPGRGGIRPVPAKIRPGFGPIALADGQEGVFFLSKHPTATGYYQITAGYQPVLATDANYAAELAKVKAAVAAFDDPTKALSAPKVEDRVQSALALAYRYRSFPPNNPTGVIDEKPIPSDESDLLVKVLLDADWAKTGADKVADALNLLPGQYGLPIVEAGPGEDPTEVRQKAFQAWHQKFGSKYRVTKLAAKPEPGK